MNAPKPDKYIAEHDGVYKLELNNEEDDYGDYAEMTNKEIADLLNDCDRRGKLLYAELARLPNRQAAEAFGRVNEGMKNVSN